MNSVFQRNIDELGRVVLPADLRQALDLEEGDTVGLSFEAAAGALMLRKSVSRCVCCRGRRGLRALPGGKFLCGECLRRLK